MTQLHGFPDPGNEVLDVLVHALRLWKYVTASKVELVIRQSTHEYGAGRNRSSIGPVNLRGNIVEAMTQPSAACWSRTQHRPWQRGDLPGLLV